MKLTLPQQDIFFEQILFPDSPRYNIGAKVEIKGFLDFDALNKAYIELINQNDAYRSVFSKNGENVEVNMLTSHQYKLGFADFSHFKNADEKANVYMEKIYTKPFDVLSGDFLHYSTLIKVKEGFYYKTGALKQEGNYENGKKEGEWCDYDERGKLIKTTKYKVGNIVTE